MTVSGTHTLTDSIFGSVNLADGSTVTFTQPNLFIGQLTTGSNVTIAFTQPCVALHICNQEGTESMNMGINNMFNTAGKSVIIYAAGDVHVSNGSDFNGSIYSKGILMVNGTTDENNCTYCAPTTMTGMYIGEQVYGYKFVNWYWNPVCSSCRVNRPNVLVILFDDSRYDSYKLDGGPDVFKSPAIDSIAEEGVRFNLTFPDFSLCAPSRASIYTGLYPCKTGVHVNGDSLHNGLSDKTVAYVLQKQAGYYTGLVGKYGLTLPPEFKHDQMPPGYNYWFSNENSGYFNLTYDDNGHNTFISGHKTDVFTSHAIDFLQSVPQNTPFLLFLNQHAPHVPYTPRPQDKGFFKGVPLPFPNSYAKYTSNYPSILYPKYMEQYDYNYKHNAHDTLLRDSLTEGQYEMLLGLESSVSSVIRELKNEGKYDSTIIIITSDNGYLMGEHYLQGKQLAYEPSIKLPLYIRYPEWFSPGTVIDSEIAMNIDLYVFNNQPTALDLQKPFGLQPAQVPRDQLSNRAELGRKVLVALGQFHSHAVLRWYAARFRKLQDERDQPLSHRRERQLLNDTDQAAQPCSHHSNYFQRHIRVLAAKILKVLARDEEKLRVFRRRSRRRIAAAVKHRNLRKRTARPLDGQHLFSTFRRHLEDANLPRDDEEEPLARIAFAEEQFASLHASLARSSC